MRQTNFTLLEKFISMSSLVFSKTVKTSLGLDKLHNFLAL